MSEETPQNRNAKILIVDDVPKNIQLLGSLLRAEGYNLIPASDKLSKGSRPKYV